MSGKAQRIEDLVYDIELNLETIKDSTVAGLGRETEVTEAFASIEGMLGEILKNLGDD